MTPLPPFVPWAIALIAVVLLVGVIFLPRFRRNASRTRPLPEQWLLSARPVFRPDERRAYRKLREALPQYVILSKLPLVRLCQPDDPRDVRYWYELLGSLQVSFCLCSGSGRVLAVIDLQHRGGESRRSLQIKEAVMRTCGIRYLRCTLEALPSPTELQAFVPALAEPVPKPSFRAPSAPAKPSRKLSWNEDGSLFSDSFFGIDSRNDPTTSEFAGLRPRDTGDFQRTHSPGEDSTPPAPPPR